MRFRITRHSGSSAPSDALDLLAERLGTSREGVWFSKASTEITATWQDDLPISRTDDERAQIGRLAVLEVIEAVCQRAPELKSDWFAVGPRR